MRYHGIKTIHRLPRAKLFEVMSVMKSSRWQHQKRTRSKSSAAMSVEVSPDSKCPICLDTFNNMSYLNLCLHKFCFCCIHEWSKNKAECPLCKQPFNSIYHSIKSEQDFKTYELRPTDNGSFGSVGGARFRYRTTMTGVQRQVQRRTSPPPDHGVMFEGLSNPSQERQNRGLRRMMMRLAARRRAASEGRMVRSVGEQEIVNFRRELYRRGVRVGGVRDGGRSRDTTAEFYQRNPACLHRLVPWLKRELVVLYGAHGSLVNIVQHIIMSRITRYDMEDRAIEGELWPFLQGRTEHFLHEFISFAKSPFNMEAYDQHAVYDCPAPSSNEDSSSNSSVITISEDEQMSVELDILGDSVSSSSLSQSVWDDETPGPSYSTSLERNEALQQLVPHADTDSSMGEEPQEYRASAQHQSPRNQMDPAKCNAKNNECLSSDENDCVIVGFVKPVAERTPELVQLSSDSEESSPGETKDVPRLPQHIRFPSLSPPASPNRDQGSSEQSESVDEEHNRSDSKERRSTSVSSRQKSSSYSERRNRNHYSKDRDRRQHHDVQSRERERLRSRNRRMLRSEDQKHLTNSPDKVGALSKSRYHSHYGSRDSFHSKWDGTDRMRTCDSRHSRYLRDAPYYNYPSQSHSHYSNDRDDGGMRCTEKQSYYSSCRRNSDQQSYSRSRSHSEDSHRRDRRRSRSRTYSSSYSPSSQRKSHHEKPGGKRKYKSRHLDEATKRAFSKSYPEPDSSTLPPTEKKSKEKHHKKSKNKSRRRRSKSLRVEIVNEDGSSSERNRKHHKKKKKHKKKSKRQKSKDPTGRCSPAVITIDSDSDHSPVNSVIEACTIDKSNPINSASDSPPDSTHLDTMPQLENQVPTVGSDRCL
ncbi:topoisomerase I binding, arginine/serine-rich a [Lampris incognitus]|uniref:topoisomerase I binding, arginine/serine-rich a n=1 Tax=Lampris incognitus TaxID=2546036 RepID=UPI0024B4E1CD|nr:topoisomerase I binding, arginine/serine-rich a [Lampris incognitus]